MASKIMGRLLQYAVRISDRLRQSVANSINTYALTNLEMPFSIHHSVEFRNPRQINLRRSSTIMASTILNGRSNRREFGISFGPDVYLKEGCYFDAYGGFIEIDGKCAFAQGTFIHGGGGVKIGTNVIAGAYCSILASNHRFDSREYPIMLQGDSCIGIKIGSNVWLGTHVVVLDGVTIGNNCVIGAGMVVTKDIPANTLVLDKRQRFEKEIFQ